MVTRSLLCFSFSLAALTHLQAQGVVRTVYNPNPLWSGGQYSGFGTTRLLKGMGDVDGDGRSDLAAVVPRAYSINPLGAAQASVFSGGTGQSFYSQYGTPPMALFGSGGFDAGRDVDGDGVPDFAVGAPAQNGAGPGQVILFSGASGAYLRASSGIYDGDGFGQFVVLCDCNGDGYADVVGSTTQHHIGGPAGPRGSLIITQSGRDGTLLWQVEDAGVGLLCIGDVNSDGCEDIACNGAILSGRDGSVIRPWSLGFATGYFNDYCRAGDVDGDGVDDFLISCSYNSAFLDQGACVLISGATGMPLRTHLGLQAGDKLGQAVAGNFHADNDGVPDYAIRAARTVFWTPTSGRVDIYSGATGAVIQSWTTPWDEREGGIATLGDTDGDGTEELVFGSPRNNTQCAGCGAAHVYQLRQGPVGSFRTYGQGCPGSDQRLPTAGARGEPRVSHAIELTLRAAQASSLVIAAIGWPAATNLASLGAPGCHAHVDPFWWLFVPTDVYGRATLPIALPNDPTLSGLRLDSQWVGIDPAANQLGITTSTAVAITIGS